MTGGQIWATVSLAASIFSLAFSIFVYLKVR